MAKVRAEIEVPNDKYCDTLDNVCPMLQKGYCGGWHCCLFDVDLETDSDNRERGRPIKKAEKKSSQKVSI